MLGIYKHNLDFEIVETGNLKTLVFIDSSEYSPVEDPERPLLEVVLPGYNSYLLANVKAQQVNVFNSSLLGINRSLSIGDLTDLPDGIWSFKFKVCPYESAYIEKKVYRVTLITTKLKELYENLDLQDAYTKEDKYIQNDLAYIHILIEGAKANANKNQTRAYENYQLAWKLIESTLKKFCKNCK